MLITPRYRLPLLLMAMLALVTGVFSGLARVGLSVPLVFSSQIINHAAFMLSAFFGTVICLERAVALNKPWVFVSPLFSALGGVAMVLQLPIESASALFVGSSIILSAASMKIFFQQKALYTFTLLIGSFSWFIGNILWVITNNSMMIISYGIGFLVLTIAGERLELTRFLPPKPKANQIFSCLLIFISIGITSVNLAPAPGSLIMGSGIAGLAIWLMRFDIARTTIHKTGLTRFVAACLLLGYGWLLFGGILTAGTGLAPGALYRDAALHAILLGFVMSMVIGHAPIIFPAVMRVKIPYSPILYVPLLVLHVSVFIRIAGSMFDEWPLRQLGSAGNAFALLIFVAILLYRVVVGFRNASGAKI